MYPEDMTVSELEGELAWLEAERERLRVADPDNEWNQVIREIDEVTRLLMMRRQV